MKIRHRKVSSFLVQKRRERLNLSQSPNKRLEISLDSSLIDESSNSFQLLMTDRIIDDFVHDIEGANTERLVNIERLSIDDSLIAEDKCPNANLIKKKAEEDKVVKYVRGRSFINGIFNKYTAISVLGVALGALIYFNKRK